MNKSILTIIALITPSVAFGAQNPMFAPDTRNSVGIYAAQGTGPGRLMKLINPFLWDIDSMTMLIAQYSQPVSIFRLPARINLNLVQNFAYGDAHGLSFSAVGVSWDVALAQWRGFYLGLGIGPYMRDSRDQYVDSRLVFGERVFIGKNIGTRFRAELFTQHFSNGNFTEINRGFNFAGIGLHYSF